MKTLVWYSKNVLRSSYDCIVNLPFCQSKEYYVNDGRGEERPSKGAVILTNWQVDKRVIWQKGKLTESSTTKYRKVRNGFGTLKSSYDLLTIILSTLHFNNQKNNTFKDGRREERPSRGNDKLTKEHIGWNWHIFQLLANSLCL
jgi:hypothetical protein